MRERKFAGNAYRKKKQQHFLTGMKRLSLPAVHRPQELLQYRFMNPGEESQCPLLAQKSQ